MKTLQCASWLEKTTFLRISFPSMFQLVRATGRFPLVSQRAEGRTQLHNTTHLWMICSINVLSGSSCYAPFVLSSVFPPVYPMHGWFVLFSVICRIPEFFRISSSTRSEGKTIGDKRRSVVYRTDSEGRGFPQ